MIRCPWPWKAKLYGFLNQVAFFIFSAQKASHCVLLSFTSVSLSSYCPVNGAPNYLLTFSSLIWIRYRLNQQFIFLSQWIMWHWVSLEFHLILYFLFVLSFDSTWTSFKRRKKTSTERVDPHPYSQPSHINHQVIRSLVSVSARFNNSYSGRESPPKSVFAARVPSTEICFAVSSSDVNSWQSFKVKCSVSFNN